MNKTELHNRINEIYDSLGEERSDAALEAANKQVEEMLEKECHIITVHAPHLDTTTMRPKFELCNCKCPHGKDGQCGSCEMFVTYKNVSGEVYSFMVFDGYCAKEV